MEDGNDNQSANRKPPDPVLVALSTALVCLSKLLRYANEPNYMNDYDAACEASKGVQAISSVLPDMNL